MILGVAAALLVLAAGAEWASSQGSEDPRRQRLAVEAHGQSVDATLGTFCLTRDEPGGGFTRLCSDSPSPYPIAGRVPTHPRDRMILRHSANASRVLVTLRDAQGGAVSPVSEASPTDAEQRAWTFDAPADAPSLTDRVQVFIRYANGDDTVWEAGVALHRHGRDTRRSVSLRVGHRRLRLQSTRACLRTDASKPPRCRRARHAAGRRELPVRPRRVLRVDTPTIATRARLILAHRPEAGERIMEPVELEGAPDQARRRWTFRFPTRLPRAGTARLRVQYSADEHSDFAIRFRRR